jgi:hypothetical protein
MSITVTVSCHIFIEHLLSVHYGSLSLALPYFVLHMNLKLVDSQVMACTYNPSTWEV